MSADASAPAADLEYRWTRAYEAPDVSGSRWSHSPRFLSGVSPRQKRRAHPFVDYGEYLTASTQIGEVRIRSATPSHSQNRNDRSRSSRPEAHISAKTYAQASLKTRPYRRFLHV